MNMGMAFFIFPKLFGVSQGGLGHIVRREICTLKRTIHACTLPSINYVQSDPLDPALHRGPINNKHTRNTLMLQAFGESVSGVRKSGVSVLWPAKSATTRSPHFCEHLK